MNRYLKSCILCLRDVSDHFIVEFDRNHNTKVFFMVSTSLYLQSVISLLYTAVTKTNESAVACKSMQDCSSRTPVLSNFLKNSTYFQHTFDCFSIVCSIANNCLNKISLTNIETVGTMSEA